MVNDLGKLLKMYNWQNSPRRGGHFGNPHVCQGTRTLIEWNNVQLYLCSFGTNRGKPVTLTLITTANDYDATHLAQHHRVVVYGYEVRERRDGEYVEVVQILLEAGANVDAADGYGETALMYAVPRDNTKIVELLRNAGATE